MVDQRRTIFNVLCIGIVGIVFPSVLPLTDGFVPGHQKSYGIIRRDVAKISTTLRHGWVQRSDGEWEWEEDDPNYVPPPPVEVAAAATVEASATPQLPSGKLKPKQSLGQNFLRDGNTVAKMINAFHSDATERGDRPGKPLTSIVELGPGAGALTDPLVEKYGTEVLQCIEVDPRAIEILAERHPSLLVHHQDVLQVSYPEMAEEEGEPLVIIGNLPYYITSQILFALADASHYGAVDCATVTMQWEVAQRMVSPTSCKDYGILSVVFQTYADVRCHFKIPPTVFYPQPKVDSALLGLHFLGPSKLRERLAGVRPRDFRTVVTTAFRQRRKTIRNTLKKLPGIEKEILMEKISSPPLPLPASVVAARERGDAFALAQELPDDWMSKRPEQLTPGQFVEVTRLMYGDTNSETNESEVELGRKVWRKLKHGV
jgi:ribosomal RNA small subunit methyltransferase A